MPASWSITYTRGTGVPEASAISSTTLSRRRSSRSRVDGSSGRAPTICATASPPAARRLVSHHVPAPISASVTSVTARWKPAGARAPPGVASVHA